MPRDLSSTFKQEKGKEESGDAIYLYRLEYDTGSYLYFAEYDTDITFDGNTYNAFPIKHNFVSQNTEGRIDAIEITVANASRYIQGHLEDYNGLRGAEVKIKLVWSNHLNDTDNVIEDTFYIEKAEANEKDVRFTLTSKFDLLSVTLPKRKFYRDYCQSEFKSSECGYAGPFQSCGKTFQQCKERGNEIRFNSFPSIPKRRFFIR